MTEPGTALSLPAPTPTRLARLARLEGLVQAHEAALTGAWARTGSAR
jgi:hypothetical protein